MKNPLIKKGDLVAFKAEYNDDNYADRLAIVVSFDLPYLTLFSNGAIIKAPMWSVERVEYNRKEK